MVSELSVQIPWLLCFCTCGREHVIEQSCSPHGGQEAVRERVSEREERGRTRGRGIGERRGRAKEGGKREGGEGEGGDRERERRRERETEGNSCLLSDSHVFL
jgi:hypothetical protein